MSDSKVSTPKVRFGNVTKDNINQLKSLNLATFPVTYATKFYKDVLKQKNNNLIKLGNFSHSSCCPDNAYIYKRISENFTLRTSSSLPFVHG